MKFFKIYTTNGTIMLINSENIVRIHGTANSELSWIEFVNTADNMDNSVSINVPINELSIRLCESDSSRIVSDLMWECDRCVDGCGYVYNKRSGDIVEECIKCGRKNYKNYSY